MTPLSEQLWALGERAHAPLVVLALFGALAIAALSRDLMKRLMAAMLAAFAAVAHLAVIGGGADGAVALVVLVFAAGALGVVLALRIGEAFGTVDAPTLAATLKADADADA